MELDDQVRILKDDKEYLGSKIQFLIDRMDLPDGCFMFPDGDVWYKTPALEEPSGNHD